ncbi:MAG: hypothetical protein HY904_02350 [Deltaproteobacteria bacterium]|nr:hypothetical protein [Deltaproteobacteria bacterium]
MTNIIAERTVTASWLESLGYTLHFRAGTWTEVLVSHAQEQWWGRGPTEDAALTHALQGMFPSHAARVLLGAVELRTSKPPPEPVSPPQSVEEPEPLAPPMASPPPDVKALAEDLPCQSDEPPGPALVEAPPPATRVLLQATTERRHVEQEAAEFLERIKRMQAELALCSAEMQRVVLVEWIAASRDLEARAGSTPPHALNLVRKIIGRVSARWWPGTMPVLQRHGGLGEAREQLVELGLGDVERPSDWAHAERLAVQVRERLEAQFAQRGLEPSGYRKSEGARPNVDNANSRLAAVIRELNTLKAVEASAPKYERAALTLRWIRTQVDDPLEWADAWGKLREALHKNPNAHWLKRALKWTDPALVPPRGFALALGIDPDARARGRKRKDLANRIQSLPTDDPHGVAAWLAEAFPVFTNEELRPLVPRHLQALQAICEDRLQERGERRRLRKLREPFSAAPAATPPAEEQAEFPEDEIATLEVDDGAPLPEEAAVRAAMSGKRCVLVTNRPEQELASELHARTGMLVDVCENKSRLLDGVVASIRVGRVAVVLLVTSFIGHDVDAKIQDACRSGAARLLRVRKGKLRVLMEELARHVANGTNQAEMRM